MLKTIPLAILLTNDFLRNADPTTSQIRNISIDNPRIGKKNKNLAKAKNIKNWLNPKSQILQKLIFLDRIFLISILK